MFLECFNKTLVAYVNSLPILWKKYYCVQKFVYYNLDILKKEKDNSFLY